jgi:hypothetical protein
LQIVKTARFILAAIFLSSAAMAQDKDTGPLPPAKPAGVKQADGADDEVPWLIVTSVVSLAGGLLLFRGHSTATVAPATTS